MTGRARAPARANPGSVVVVELAPCRYGIATSSVVELARVPAITPLPRGPPIVEGVVNFRGTPVPVLDVRARFGLPRTPPKLSDHLVIASAGARLVAFRVDRVVAVMGISDADFSRADAIGPGIEHLAGVVRLPDGLVLIHDIATFLAPAESAALSDLERDGALSCP